MMIYNSAMKRLLLLSVLLLFLIACRQEPADVSFMVFGDAAELTAYQSLVDAFIESQSEVTVTLTHIPSQGDYRARLATDFAAGTPPDVSLMNFRRIGAFVAAEQLEPLNAYLDESEAMSRDEFYPVTLDAFTWQDQLMCIPQNISSLVVYYNRDLFMACLLYTSDAADE